MRKTLVLKPSVVSLVAMLVFAQGALADSLRLTMQPNDLGPFQPAVGGFIDLTVAMELFDSEADGVDTQGISLVAFNILTDTGLTIPWFFAAPTGESGSHGPADVEDPRYDYSQTTEPLFRGGYGIDGWDVFGGRAEGDDRTGIGSFIAYWWADVQPNAPGLQPAALAGIGYGERPAGGDWLFATGRIPIPTQAGLYTVELDLYAGAYVLPDVDLTVDQTTDWRGYFDLQDLIGDSFTFTVLPEPGSALLLLCGAWFVSRRVR